MSRRLTIGKRLSCGCCGTCFKIWKGYEDQDQDNGYGICRDCQASIKEHDEKEWDKAIKTLREGLSEKHRKKFDTFDRDLQKAFVCDALDKGHMKFHITRG